MIKRQRLTHARSQDIKMLIPALRMSAERHRQGLFAYELPVPAGRRPTLMRYLREHGVPIMSLRDGPRSAWFITTFHPKVAQRQLAERWNRRTLEDHYAETCRMHMSLLPGRHTKRLTRLIAGHAPRASIADWS